MLFLKFNKLNCSFNHFQFAEDLNIRDIKVPFSVFTVASSDSKPKSNT